MFGIFTLFLIGRLQTIENKFGEFRLNVDAGAERVVGVDTTATNLIEQQNPNSAVILESQEKIRYKDIVKHSMAVIFNVLGLYFSDSWKDLNEAIDQRTLKLQGAGEIHRFNRDVEDALSRIQEKYSSIPDDLGRDLKQTQAYQKSHSAFENELVALEAQVRVTPF